jgi:hypothetical protein
VGASTSRNPKGLNCLYRDNFTFGFTGDDAWEEIGQLLDYEASGDKKKNYSRLSSFKRER